MGTSSTRLVLICGLPARAKSTLARELSTKIPAISLDKDGWATQLGADLWDEEFRGVGVKLHDLDGPLEELIERAERRNVSGEWTGPSMTRGHFAEWASIFQPPDEEELLLFDEPVAEE